MINFLNLEYFLAAAEELNSTRTVRKLFISQQSLGNHISSLEKEFDVVLFNRTSPLALTYMGRVLKARAKELPSLRGEIYKEISDIEDLSTGQLAIGVSHTRGRAIPPEILPTYQAQSPGIELRLVEGNSSQLASDLFRGNVDLMINLLPFTVENVETVPICGEEVLMVIPDELLKKIYPNHLEKIKQVLPSMVDVTLPERCPFVLSRKGNRIRTASDEIFKGVQMSPRVVLEMENIKTMPALRAKGMGIAFYPKVFMNPDQSSRSYRNAMLENSCLNLCPLNYSRAHGVLDIGYYKGWYIFRAIREFIRIAQERTPYPADCPAE